MGDPKFQTNVCDEIFFYNSDRESWIKYDLKFTLPPQTGCFFKYNGTRSYIQPVYPQGMVMYYAYQDLIYFEAEDYDPTTIYFNNSRLIVTSGGDILGERNNYFVFYLLNADSVPNTVQIKFYQAASALLSGAFLLSTLSFIF